MFLCLVPKEARRGARSPWNCSYGSLWDTVWVPNPGALLPNHLSSPTFHILGDVKVAYLSRIQFFTGTHASDVLKSWLHPLFAVNARVLSRSLETLGCSCVCVVSCPL